MIGLWTSWSAYVQDLDPFAWWFIFGMALVGAGSTYVFLWPLLDFSSELRGTSLQGLSDDDWEPSTMGGRLGDAVEQFVDRWTEQAIEVPPIGRASPVRPEAYLSRRQVVRVPNRKIAETLPAVFASLGILGTFIGIIFGLSQIEIANASVVMEGVQSLLDGMHTAFASSVWGIILSICWLTGLRGLQGSIDGKLARLSDELRMRFPTLTPNLVFASILSEQRDLGDQVETQVELQRATNGHLQNLGADIADLVEDAFERIVSTELTPALDRMAGSVEGLTADLADKQMEGLDEMVESFQERLTGSLGEQFHTLAESVEAAARHQETLTQSLEDIYDRLGELSERQARLLETSTDASERFLESVDGLTTAHERITESAASLGGVASGVDELAQRLEGESEVFADANQELREALAEQFDRIETQVVALTECWNEVHGSLQGLEGELKESLQGLEDLTGQRLEQVLGRFDSELAKVVDHLSGTLVEIREATEELGPSVAQIERMVEGLDEPLEAVGSAVEISQETLQGTEAALSEMSEAIGLLAPASERFENLAEALPGAADSARKLAARMAERGDGVGRSASESDGEGGPRLGREDPGVGTSSSHGSDGS